MKFLDPVVIIGFILAVVFIQNALLYGADLSSAVITEWIAAIALIGLSIWVILKGEEKKEAHPAEADVKHKAPPAENNPQQ